MQGVLEPVATYRRWSQLGRQVLKGSKAKVIVRPITIRREEPDGTEAVFTKFKPVRCLFGLSETDGDELPPPPPIPEWNEPHAFDALHVTRVPFTMLNGNLQGYSYERNLAINPLAEHPRKTMMHELGHIVIGHTEPNAHADYVLHRGLKEFQAEATAHLVMNELGQLSEDAASSSRAYIQHWLQGERPPEQAFRQVFSATDTILKAGRPPANNHAEWLFAAEARDEA